MSNCLLSNINLGYFQQQFSIVLTFFLQFDVHCANNAVKVIISAAKQKTHNIDNNLIFCLWRHLTSVCFEIGSCLSYPIILLSSCHIIYKHQPHITKGPLYQQEKNQLFSKLDLNLFFFVSPITICTLQSPVVLSVPNFSIKKYHDRPIYILVHFCC